MKRLKITALDAGCQIHEPNLTGLRHSANMLRQIFLLSISQFHSRTEQLPTQTQKTKLICLLISISITAFEKCFKKSEKHNFVLHIHILIHHWQKSMPHDIYTRKCHIGMLSERKIVDGIWDLTSKRFFNLHASYNEL